MNPSRLISRWITPALLLLIGGTQMFLAHKANLSLWKGGGFGMFAAIDSPGMRTISAVGLDAENNLVYLDARRVVDQRTKRRLRSLPDQATLQQVAQQLLDSEFVPMARTSLTPVGN